MGREAGCPRPVEVGASAAFACLGPSPIGRSPVALIRPLQSFLDAETGSGILIIGAVAIAIAWANSPWRETYEHVWGTELVLRLSRWSVSDHVRGWIAMAS